MTKVGLNAWETVLGPPCRHHPLGLAAKTPFPSHPGLGSKPTQRNRRHGRGSSTDDPSSTRKFGHQPPPAASTTSPLHWNAQRPPPVWRVGTGAIERQRSIRGCRLGWCRQSILEVMSTHARASPDNVHTPRVRMLIACSGGGSVEFAPRAGSPASPSPSPPLTGRNFVLGTRGAARHFPEVPGLLQTT